MADTTASASLRDKMAAEITPASSPLMLFLVKYAKAIAACLVLFVIAACGYGVYSWKQGKDFAAAQDELAKVLIIPDSTARLAALEVFLQTAPERARPATNMAIARTAMERKDYARAYAAWDALSENAQSALYLPAMIGKAESLSMQDKPAEALLVLEKISLEDDSEASSLVNSLIVAAAEASGDIKKALAASEKIIPQMARRSPEEAEFWRQKAASLKLAL